MATGLMQDVEPNVLDYSMPGGSSTRSFWTKRRRSSVALVAVMALVAGIAVAYKLFEQEVPNNVVRDASNFDYTIEARDVDAGETSYRPAGLLGSTDPALRGVFRHDYATCPTTGPCDIDMFPGDTREARVRITNANAIPARDASFNVWVTKITVEAFCVNGLNPVTGGACGTSGYSDVTGSAEANKFLGFFRMSVDKQQYSQTPVLAGDLCQSNGDCGEHEDVYAQSCAPAALTSYTKNAPCKLGIVRAAGSETSGLLGEDIPSGSQVASDDREYIFRVSELDNGTDQSFYKGWRVIWSLNFAARVPAEAESGRYGQPPFPLDQL